MSLIHQAKRTPFKRYVTDPLEGISVGFVCFILWALPLSLARQVGKGIGTLIYYVARWRNHIALKNMSVGLPDKTEAEKRMILKKMWQHFGMLFAESAHGTEVLKKSRRVRMNLLHDAFEKGKGGFVCTAHFGGWEFDVASLVGPDFRMNPIYRKANNPWLNKILFERRRGIKIPKGAAGARMMIETLNQGDFIAILCDQKLREGMEIPFFGRPAMTATAMASLSIKKGAPIYMVKGVRGKDNIYTFSVEQKVEIPKGLSYQDTLKAVMTEVNNIYWAWIKQNPEQYLWIHRRFEKSFYEE